ncbi:MAG TPA: hypothetical protein VFR80_08560, partial [Pyrinomonadaceae bacterium]|nr:hypothetical protein [Pyrinomonadaceae bacterium]
FGNSESHWPQFSGDGRFIIYQHFEPGETTSLWRVPIEGGTPAKVTEGFAARPAISPDGQRLGFWQNDAQPNTRWKLAVFSLEKGTLISSFDVAATVHVNWDAVLRWSADGRSLTYVNNLAGVENVWGQPIDGGPAKQLTNFADNRILSMDWSRDGHLVASRGVVTSDVVLITDADQ